MTYHDASRLLAIHVQNHRSLCDGVQLSGSGFQLGVLETGQAAFNDRDYQWDRVPREVAGLMFTRKAGSVEADIRVYIPSSASGLTDAGSKGVFPSIYAGVCPQQSGHNQTLLTGVASDAWRWEPTSLSFVYGSNDRVVQLFKWVQSTRVGRKARRASKPFPSGGPRSATHGISFAVPIDKTFCGTMVFYSPLLVGIDPGLRDITQ